MFDKRGIGLSDPVAMAALPSIEEWMDDLRAVMDAVGSERAAVVASMAGGYLGSVFAATYPERTTALVLVDAFASFGPGDGFADEVTRIGDLRRAVEDTWGHGMMLDVFAPDVADQAAIRSSWGRYDDTPPVRALSLLWCR